MQFQCYCGETFSDTRALSRHRTQCELLRNAIIADLHRVTQNLRRVPSVTEYSDHKAPLIPGKDALALLFGSWNALLTEAGLPVSVSKGPYDTTDKVPAATKITYYWQREAA